jgi:hypothetical protein
MSKRPQFSLKAILVIVAVLAVPLALLGSGHPRSFIPGYLAFCVAVGGSVGYLLSGPKGVLTGVTVGLLLGVILGCCLVPTVYLHFVKDP